MTAVRERIRRAYGRDAVVIRPLAMIDPRDEQTPHDVSAAIRAFEAAAFDGNTIRRHALTFSTASFAARMRALVDPMVAS